MGRKQQYINIKYMKNIIYTTERVKNLSHGTQIWELNYKISHG